MKVYFMKLTGRLKNIYAVPQKETKFLDVILSIDAFCVTRSAWTLSLFATGLVAFGNVRSLVWLTWPLAVGHGRQSEAKELLCMEGDVHARKQPINVDSVSLEPMTFDVLLYTCNTHIHLEKWGMGVGVLLGILMGTQHSTLQILTIVQAIVKIIIFYSPFLASKIHSFPFSSL